MRYIGMDIGDGESAITVLTDESVVEPVVLTLNGFSSTLSAVGVIGGTIHIGESALLQPSIRELRSRFKSRFLNDSNAEVDIERFAYGIRSIAMRESDVFADDQYLIALGCPAGWISEDRKRYLDIMRRAGFHNVYLVSESRAAFFYAKYAHEIKADPALLSKTTLVIDIGSSTTDFAYIVDGKESNIGTFGDVKLGGGLIEATMVRLATEQSRQRSIIEDTFRESLTWKNRAEITARRLKEQYFLDEEAWTGIPCTASASIYYDEPVTLRFSLDAATIETILTTPVPELSGMTFKQCLTETLAHAAEATKDHPPALVILTGGASRMRFFQEACRAAFPDAVAVICPNPEYSIAKGLAYAARTDTRLKAFQADIDDYFARGEVRALVEESIDDLTQPLVHELADKIVQQAIFPVLSEWRKGEIDLLSDLEAPISARAQVLMEDPHTIAVIQPIIEKWCAAIYERIQVSLDDILKKHDIERRSMALSRIRPPIAPGKIPLALDNRGLDTLVVTITGLVVGGLCGGTGVALIATGILGWIIGLLIGIAVGYLGKKAVDTAIRNTSLPKFLRTILLGALRNRMSSPNQMRKIETELGNSIEQTGFEKKLVDDITQSLETQIAALARAVEMPIH